MKKMQMPLGATKHNGAVVKDAHYYKKRAINAEKALLELRIQSYIDSQQRELEKVEKDLSNKMKLYSYSAEKTGKLQQELSLINKDTEERIQLAKELCSFNINAIDKGYELGNLPNMESIKDHKTFQLPKLDALSEELSPKASPSEQSFSPEMDLLSDDNSGLPVACTGEDLLRMLNGGASQLSLCDNESVSSKPDSPTLNDSFDSEASGKRNQRRRKKKSGTSSEQQLSQNGTIKSNLDMESSPPEEISPSFALPGFLRESLASISTPWPSTASDKVVGNYAQPFLSDQSLQRGMFSSSSAVGSNLFPTYADSGLNYFGTTAFDYSADSNSVAGLDNFASSAEHQTKPTTAAVTTTTSMTWSSVAAAAGSGSGDSEWNTVAKKKPATRPFGSPFGSTSALGRPTPVSVQQTYPQSIADSNRFERMVRELMNKHGLLRDAVIKVLREVRDRKGEQFDTCPLSEIMQEADRLVASKEFLKHPSLVVRTKDIRDHEEPCDNQLCVERLKALKYKTEYCISYQTTKTCQMPPGRCVYAHGPADLRPLPKTELCERYLEGRCTNPRCVYAHGHKELRSAKMSKHISTAEYIRSQNTRHDWSTNNTAAFENLDLTPDDLQGNDECAICLDTMSQASRQQLDCGHDGFHYKCLKKWIAGENTRSCPMCRSAALLPEEYPSLSK